MGCILTKSNTEQINTLVKNILISDPIKKFNLLGIKGNFYVKSVYDGDTVTILVPICLSVYSSITKDSIDAKSISNPKNEINMFEIRVRLMGIDTPEMKPPKNMPNRDEHIKKAIEAKEFLSEQILNKVITIEFLTNDKYGRPLVNLFLNDNIQSINNLMIQKGYAKAYDGGTKDTDF